MVINARKIFEKIVSIFLDILIIIFGFILLVFIYKNIQTKILGNDYSSLFGYSAFEVITGSMEGNEEDSISVGDWIIVKYTNNIQLDDIITYQKDGSFVTHRVIEEYNGTYITKGDANNTKDDPVSREQIVGKVVKILPNFGIIKKTLFNPAVLLSLIISFYLVGYVLRSIKKDKEQIKSKKITEKVDNVVSNVLDKVFDNKEEKKESVTDKYDFIETEVDVSRTVSDEFDEIDDDEEIVLPEVDMDKTMYFRIVSVNKSDIDYINSQTGNDVDVNASKLSDEELEVASTEEVNNCIEMLNTRRKKFKNIIDKIMYIKGNELENIIFILNRKEKYKSNESTIGDTLINTFIRAKYYESSQSNKSVNVRINNALKETGTRLIDSYKGKDAYYTDKVNKFIKYLMLINDLEQIDKLFNNIQAIRENYNNKLLTTFKSEITGAHELKDMVNSIIKIKKVHESVVKESINRLMSNTFELEILDIDDKKKLKSAKLNHNINFNKVYSDYIVDKTYSEGIIAEDKILILLTLLMAKIVKDVINGEELYKYLVYLPESIYKKNNKLEKILSLLDDEIAKDNIIFFNDYEEIIGNKRVIKTIRKEGYHFAIRFSNDSKVKAKDSAYISLAEYLFVDSKVFKEIGLNDVLTDEDKNNLIKVDVYEKVIN